MQKIQILDDAPSDLDKERLLRWFNTVKTQRPVGMRVYGPFPLPDAISEVIQEGKSAKGMQGHIKGVKCVSCVLCDPCEPREDWNGDG